MVTQLIKLPFLICILIIFSASTLVNPANSPLIRAQAVSQALPEIPTSLKNFFMIGLGNSPGDLNWMTGSKVPWDLRYQYLAGGVNTSSNWKTWQWDQLPPGQFALDFMNDSANNGYLPVFTWYQLLQSSPATGGSESDKDFNNLNNSSTMHNYFADFKLLMDKAKTFGKTVIIHVEPDLWAYLQQRSTNPNSVTALVASSGYGDVVAGYPDTAAGFARALVALRDKYAPNALLAYHISPWASSYGDLASSKSPSFNVSGAAQETASFYNQTGANFDLLFYDIADRDAGLYEKWGNPNTWWDITNSTYPNFNRFHQFVVNITAFTGKRGMLWQVPLGNTLYRTMNNTDYHFQDNKAQYYLNSSNQHIQDAVNSGLIGIMFGSGGNTATIYTDHSDGITNPAPINGNNLVSDYTDDDGGHIRVQAGAYYSRGPVYFETPKFNSTPAPGTTINLTGQPGQSISSTLQISNAGNSGTTLVVNPLVLDQAVPGTFTVVPSDAFSLDQGAPSRRVSVSCTAPAPGISITGTLTFPVANDPALTNAVYHLVCRGLIPLVVTSSDQNGPGLTLSAALNTYISGQNIITFAVNGNQVNVSGAGSLVVNRGPVVIDGGGCDNGQPKLTINGTGASGPGLTIASGTGVELRNIRITGFNGVQIAVTSGGNKFSKCVVIKSSSL